MVWSVRCAVWADERPIIELLQLRHEEEGLGAFNPEMAEGTVRRGILRNKAMIGVIRGKKAVEASIGMYITNPWDSDQDYISDLWHFVHPDYRRSTHAKTLLEFAKWAAGELKMPLLMQAANNDKTANKIKLYERQFKQPAGNVFMFVP